MSHQKALELASGGMKPTDIAAYLDITVIYSPFKAVKGIAMKLGSSKIIQIDESLSEVEKQMVCGHEIGHFLFHGETNFMFIYEKTFFIINRNIRLIFLLTSLFSVKKRTSTKPRFKKRLPAIV